MALEAGSITVNPDGSHVGSGLALAMYEAKRAAFAARPSGADFLAMVGDSTIGAVVASILGAWADDANAYASAIVAHLQANAEVSVTIGTSSAGLQRTPNPNNPSTPTLAPSAPVTLTGGLT